MIKLKNIKKILARVVLCTFILSATVPAVSSFAGSLDTSLNDDTDRILDDIKNEDQYKQIDPEEGEGASEDTSSAELRDKLVDELEDALSKVSASDNDKVSIVTGTNIINEVCSKAKAPLTFTSQWINNFVETAGQLGIPTSATLDDWFGEEADVKGAAKKIKLLQWEGSDFNNGAMSTLLEDLNTGTSAFTDLMVGYGLTMCVAFSCLTLSEMVADRKFSQEAFGTTMFKMFFGLWIIYNFKTIIGFAVYWGGYMVTRFAGAITDEAIQYALYKNALATSLGQTIIEMNPIANATANLMTNVKTLGSWAGKLLVASQTLPAHALGAIGSQLSDFLGNSIVQLVSSFTVYSIIIEIMVRATFTPIAIADMYNDTLRSSAVRYIKKIVALALTGVVMYVILYATSTLKQHIPFYDPVALMAINLTMLGLLARARSIAEDIIGVH